MSNAPDLEKDADGMLDPSAVYTDWERLVQEPDAQEADSLSDLLDEERGQAYFETLFNEMNFPGMDLMAVSFFRAVPNLAEQHALFRRLARDFVRFLSYNYAMDLRAAGVTEEGLFYMKKGQVPENYTVHLKYPIAYGGTMDFSNMVFMQNTPFHEDIHVYLNKQLISETGKALTPETLYVPVPTGKVYIPFSLFTGSGGKNKQDRSVYAGFSAAAFKQIALKAMPGR